MHIISCIHPEVAFAVSYFARFIHRPKVSLFARVQHFIVYFKGTACDCLCLGVAPPLWHEHCNFDFANFREDRRSVTAFVVKIGIRSACCKSAKQPTLCRSTAEAKYIAAVEVGKKVQYVHALVEGMKLDPECILMGMDNRAAMFLVEDPMSAARIK
jgi:hypothetical protein